MEKLLTMPAVILTFRSFEYGFVNLFEGTVLSLAFYQ